MSTQSTAHYIDLGPSARLAELRQQKRSLEAELSKDRLLMARARRGEISADARADVAWMHGKINPKLEKLFELDKEIKSLQEQLYSHRM